MKEQWKQDRPFGMFMVYLGLLENIEYVLLRVFHEQRDVHLYGFWLEVGMKGSVEHSSSRGSKNGTKRSLTFASAYNAPRQG
jgi:hypothetical protein